MLLAAMILTSFFSLPPKLFQHDTVVHEEVMFLNLDKIEDECIRNGAVKTNPTYKVWGCTIHKRNMMVLPNPCEWKPVNGHKDRDDYADLVCHEMGHTIGWTSNHETEPTENEKEIQGLY